MTTTLSRSAARPLRGSPHRAGLLATLRTIIAVQKQRRQLRKLDNLQLRDLGLSRADADREASRPLWDVPAKWRK